MEELMFPVLKKYLINHGFDVKAEILNADIVAKKEDLVIIVEMKTAFSTKLIYQGLKRMHISDYVYLAIPKPTDQVLKSDNFKEKKTIVRRLEMGLILVDTMNDEVEVLLDPETYHFHKDKKKKRALLKEFNLRSTSMNIGGVNRTKLMTAYKELSLLILDALSDGQKTTKFLREYTNRKKVVSILQKNYYGWFCRVERGVYGITHEGEKACITYMDALILIKNHFDFYKGDS